MWVAGQRIARPGLLARLGGILLHEDSALWARAAPAVKMLCLGTGPEKPGAGSTGQEWSGGTAGEHPPASLAAVCRATGAAVPYGRVRLVHYT